MTFLKFYLLQAALIGTTFSANLLSQNVGIGTTSPIEKLDVNGNVNISGSIEINGDAGVGGEVLVSQGAGAAPVWQTISGVPAGVIVMWSGALANVPAGWALCDGGNGTPDLRDRFIYSVSTGENPGATGGANIYSLSNAQLPTHTHSVSGTTSANGNHNHSGTTSTDGAHTHTMPGYHLSGSSGPIPWYNWANSNFSTNTNTTSSSGNHSHSFTTNTAGSHTHTFSTTTGSSGAGGAIDNRPAYFKLAFIMKL